MLVVTLVAFAVLEVPLTWALALRVRRAQADRERFLQRAVDASDQERRRIAGDLHDGPVQELASLGMLSMPDLDGVEVTRRLAERSPETRVVVFTSFSDRKRIVQALDAGAIGYLLKDAEPDEIHAAIRADKADRPPPGDQREDREGPPHEPVPADRRGRPNQAALWAERTGALRD